MDQESQQPAVCSLPVDANPRESLDVPALTRRMVAGDETAYRTFHDAYFDRLSRYLLVVTGGDEEAAREALQGTLVRMVRHVRVFPDDAVFWSWLTVLARSALSDQTRKRRRYLAFLDRFTRHSSVEQTLEEPDPADEELRALLDRNLAALPFDERDLLERKYFARESVRQIAEELHETEKAVESRLGRIRRKLKAALLQSLKHE